MEPLREISCAVRLISVVLLLTSGISSAQEGPGPRPVLDKTGHHFGAVKQGETVTCTFSIRNEGSETLKISRIDLPFPGMKIRFAREVLPKQEKTITLEWNTASSSGDMEGSAVLKTNVPERSDIPLLLKATVRPVFRILPMPAAFFTVYRGDRAEQVLQFMNTDSVPVKITGLRKDGNHFDASYREMESGKKYELKITVPESTETGRYMEALYVETDHPSVPVVGLPVNVFVKNELYAFPEFIDFGIVSLKQLRDRPDLVEMLQQKIFIKKRSGDFEIRSLESNIPALIWTVDPAAGAAGSFELRITLDLQQLSPGSLTGHMKVRTGNEKFPEILVPVSGEIR